MIRGHVALQGPGLQTTGIGYGRGETNPDEVAHAIGIPAIKEYHDRVMVLRKAIDEWNASARQSAANASSPDIMEQIRRLGELRHAGLLTAQQFEAKKAELLARL